MDTFSRRTMLALTGLTAAAAGLTGCSSDEGGSTGSGGGSGDTLSFWSHQGNQKTLQKQIFAEFAKAPGGMPVKYTFYNASKMGQSLQLAKQSKQLPDIHTNAGLQLSAPALISGGWVTPLALDDAAMKRMKPHLVNGIHIFDDKVYTFPQFDYRTYSSATWFNRDVITKAGLDPDDPPTTYDEFRAAAKKVQAAGDGKVYGWIWNAGMTARMGDQVNKLAEAAGFQGGGGRLYKTGEFAYDADPYVTVIEFLQSLTKDKLLFPGSTTYSDKVARARWVTGVAGYYIDGPWCPGVVRESFPSFKDKLGVGPILVPEAGMPARTYAGPQGGVFWMSPNRPADRSKAGNLLLSDYFTTHEYFTKLAGWMPQPPLDPKAIEESEAYPSYKKLVKWMAAQTFLAPTTVIRNVDATQVAAQTHTVQPDLGHIVQGVLTGEISNIKTELKKLSDSVAKEFERALKAAKAKGAKIDESAYAFANWKPGADYTTDMYTG